MAIVVRHQGNPASTAAASYESGRGRRRDGERRQATALVANELSQSRAAATRAHERQIAMAGRDRRKADPADRGARPVRRVEDGVLRRGGGNSLRGPTPVSGVEPSGAATREGDGYFQKKQLDLYADEVLRNRDREDYDYKQRTDRQKYDYQQRTDRSRYDYQLTAKQKAEFDRLNQVYEDARQSGDFTDDELKDLRRQVTLKQAGIQALPRLKDEPQDPWEIAQSKIFTDPETGQRGYLDRDGVPQFFDDQPTTDDDAENAFDRQQFDKRYEALRKSLAKPEYKKDSDGKQIMIGERAPSADEILQAMQEQDQAAEAYAQGLMRVSSDESAPADGSSEVPSSAPDPDELQSLGQDPERPGGYSSLRIKANGRYVPNTIRPFISNEGFDRKAAEAFAAKKEKESKGQYSKGGIMKIIERDLNELMAD